MDYLPPDNTGDRGCVARKVVVFFRSPWLVLCGIILFAAVITGGVSISHFFKNNNANIVLSSLDSKAFQQAFQSDPLSKESYRICVASKTSDINQAPIVVAVRSKDSLPKIFKRLGVNDKNVANIVKLKQAQTLKNLKSGHKLSLSIDDTRTKVQQITYEVDALNTLVVTAVNNRWQFKTNHVEPTSKVKYVAATVKGSIYTAGKNAGIPRKLMAQVADVLNYKINVNKLRNGDKLALFYKEYEPVNSKKVRDNEIVAIELAHADKIHHIISFTDPHGNTNFYTPDGHSIKPSFIRYPISFRRISSKFAPSRFHPILGIPRPHNGVDLAAATGTPIKATSNGRIQYAGYKGGHGRTVIIQNGIYSTWYAHLSRFASNTHSGKYVNQGEVIGYVGSSGLATSSHLHYEFRVNGVPRDPLSVKLPAGEMIAAEYRGRFFALSKKMLAQLDYHRKVNKVLAMYTNIKFD